MSVSDQIVLAAAVIKGRSNFPNSDYFYGLFHPGEAAFAMLTAKGKYSLKALARLAALEGGNVAVGARVRPKPQRSTWTNHPPAIGPTICWRSDTAKRHAAAHEQKASAARQDRVEARADESRRFRSSPLKPRKPNLIRAQIRS